MRSRVFRTVMLQKNSKYKPIAKSQAQHAHTLIAAALLVSGPFSPMVAQANDVSGKLEVSMPATSKKAPDGAYIRAIQNGYLPIKPDAPSPARVLGVVLTGSGGASPTCRFEVQNGNLSPGVWAAKANGRLSFTNQDGMPYQLYVKDHPTFKPVQTAPGSERKISVGKSGAWVLHDKAYRHITGGLHVMSDLVACGTIDDSGMFSFTGVAPGEYKLKVLHKDKVIKEVPVTVKPTMPKTTLPSVAVTVPVSERDGDNS